MSLFDELMEEEPAKEIEPEYIEIKAHERKRKKKSAKKGLFKSKKL